MTALIDHPFRYLFKQGFVIELGRLDVRNDGEGKKKKEGGGCRWSDP